MTMSCKMIEKSLIDYLDHELNEEEATEVKNHLDQCTFCSEKLKEMTLLQSHLSKKNLPDDPFFEEMRRSLFERIRGVRLSKEMVLPVRRRSWAPVLVPVAFLVLLWVGVWIVPGRYQEFAMKKDLTELARLDEGTIDLSPNETESLEEEAAIVDEFLTLAQAEETTSDSLEEDLELLNALGEGEDLSEEEMEELEEELASLGEEV